MTAIWLGALGLGLLACLFVVWPMVAGRGQEQSELELRKQANIDLFKQQQKELEKQLQLGEIDEAQKQALEQEAAAELLQVSTDDEEQSPQRRSGMVVLACSCLALVLGVLWFYQFNGAEEDLIITTQLQQKLAADNEALKAGKPLDKQLALDLLSQVEAKLEKEPQNVQYLYLKANTAIEVQQFPKALQAYKAMIEIEESPLIMAELAQLLHYLMKGQFTPEIDLLISKSLEQDPENILALELQGLKRFQSKDYKGAIKSWGTVFLKAGPQSVKGRSIAAGIQKARQLLEAEGGVKGDEGSAEPVAKPAALKLQVALADGLQLPAEHTVFIYARAWQGAPMPLAIARYKVSDLPVRLELTDAMAMTPNLKLSSFKSLELIARVSASGKPKAEKGDYQASLGPVNSADNKQIYQLLISTPI